MGVFGYALVLHEKMSINREIKGALLISYNKRKSVRFYMLFCGQMIMSHNYKIKPGGYVFQALFFNFLLH